MHPAIFLISLSSRCDRVRQISRSVYGISGKPAERELIQPGSTLCVSHFCPLYWSDFYCDSSMKQTTQKYLNDLPHSLLCFWVSSLAGLAEQACILGFGSGSGQLQFQAERKICCSHGGMGASRSLVEICHTSLCFSSEPKRSLLPISQRIYMIEPKVNEEGYYSSPTMEK